MRTPRLLLVLSALSCAGTAHPAEPAPTPNVNVVAVVSGRADAAVDSVESSATCDQKCRGRAPQHLVEAVSRAAGNARACYTRAMKERADQGLDPIIRGRMVVKIRITESGAVGCTQVTSDDIGSAGLTRCTLQQLTSSSFADSPPVGGCLDVAIPLRFEPKEGDAGANDAAL